MKDKTKKLTRADVQALHHVHGTSTRDQASELLGGDPIQAELVTQHLFRSMIGLSVDYVASAEKMPAWIANEVVRLCLIQTGNEEVADWEMYLLNHPDEKRKRKKRAPVADAPLAASNVIPLRRRTATVPATRNAREQLRAREEKAVTPRADVEPEGPEAPRT